MDALAPIRNSEHEVHASVVATLLAEMDGLCDRFVLLYIKFSIIICDACTYCVGHIVFGIDQTQKQALD